MDETFHSPMNADAPPWPAADGDGAESEGAESEGIDQQIAAVLAGVPAPAVPLDLSARVLNRVKRRRVLLRGSAMAAAVALLLVGWRLLPGGPNVTDGGDQAEQEALVAQWDQLLDEAVAVPAPVIELDVLKAQRELLSALQRIESK
jgi:hypothetical protein